jgi:Ca2+/Na+ antiporter
MALGSSAPEIMLASVEAIATSFKPADLGPSTIVGSAAFNLMVITGFCI